MVIKMRFTGFYGGECRRYKAVGVTARIIQTGSGKIPVCIP